MNNKKQIYFNNYPDIFKKINFRNYRILIVCTKSFLNSYVINDIKNISDNVYVFSNFSPNPTVDNVKEAINCFKKNKCNFIISLGGGSAIDIAKCVKAWINLDSKKDYFKQNIIANDILHLSIPTTAGTGSEATHFLVVYDENNTKHSIAHQSLIPDYVYLNPEFLDSLPDYQKKSTMLDAMCQSIESYWAINSDKESKKYAEEALELILKYYDEYIKGITKVNKYIFKAANLSGKAINISKTTAPHAMSYKITSLYHLSHGHAVAVLLPYVWEFMFNNIDKSDNKDNLEMAFNDLNKIFDSKNSKETIEKIFNIYNNLNIQYKGIIKKEDIDILTSSVNIERLNNNPIYLHKEDIKNIYLKLV